MSPTSIFLQLLIPLQRRWKTSRSPSPGLLLAYSVEGSKKKISKQTIFRREEETHAYLLHMIGNEGGVAIDHFIENVILHVFYRKQLLAGYVDKRFRYNHKRLSEINRDRNIKALWIDDARTKLRDKGGRVSGERRC